MTRSALLQIGADAFPRRSRLRINSCLPPESGFALVSYVLLAAHGCGCKNDNGRFHMFKRTYCAAALMTACATIAGAQVRDFRPVTEQVLANPDPGDWLMLNRTFDQQRYSPLTQINKSNVGQLRMAWSRGLPAGTQETVPIRYGGG